MRGSLVRMGVAAVLLCSARAVAAQETAKGPTSWLSANVALTSDYVFRGISQTQGEPAIQGGIDVKHPSGLYAGTWGSSVNFGEGLEGGRRAEMELDVYGGLARSLAGLVDFDVGALYYAYPGAAGSRGYDYWELGTGLSRDVGPLSAGVAVKYSPDFFGGAGRAVDYAAQLEVPVSVVTLTGSLGQQRIERNDVAGTPDYAHWSVGAAVSWSGFQLTGQYVGTSLRRAECFGGTGLCRGRAVVGVSRAM
ncbi:MAG TPA: TorF family putative porin [Longimicrobiaceae bacterium]|nr:TorF family putative porin [Longimicrobiaceae bacterium]